MTLAAAVVLMALASLVIAVFGFRQKAATDAAALLEKSRDEYIGILEKEKTLFRDRLDALASDIERLRRSESECLAKMQEMREDNTRLLMRLVSLEDREVRP